MQRPSGSMGRVPVNIFVIGVYLYYHRIPNLSSDNNWTRLLCHAVCRISSSRFAFVHGFVCNATLQTYATAQNARVFARRRARTCSSSFPLSISSLPLPIDLLCKCRSFCISTCICTSGCQASVCPGDLVSVLFNRGSADQLLSIQYMSS